MNILVTGGAGYIGSHVAKELRKEGFTPIIIDNLSTGNRGAVLDEKLIVEDLKNKEAIKKIIKENKIEGVMHFAGSIKVPESVIDPIKYYQNNTRNSLNLIEVCSELKVENFIFSSTAAVYGELENGFATEETEKSPINPYGRSKLMTEWMLEDYAKSTDQFNYAAIRYFNVCGADPDGEIGQAFPEPFHLINIACEAASGKREKMAIFGTDYPTEDGTCIRDYIHVTDLARAHILALKFLINEKKSEVFNCGYGHGYSVREIVGSVKRVTEVDFKVETSERRDGDPASLVAISSKLKTMLGWTPTYDNLDIIIQTAYKWEMSPRLKEWREIKA